MAAGQQQLEGVLLGCGNPLLDISAEVPESFLEKYDLKLDNAILAEDKHLPLYKELVDHFPVEYIAGGATQNAIRVARWMTGVPKSSSYIGCIGNDAFGNELQKAAEADGVRVHYLKDPQVGTGTCAVLVHNKERSLVANLGAANHYKFEHMQTPETEEIVSKAKVIYIAGFFLTVSPESILYLGKRAAAENKIFAMNLAAPFILTFFGEKLDQCLPYCDYVFGNESEAAELGRVKGWGSDINTIALKLSSLPKENGARGRTVVFTQGSSHTVIAKDGAVAVFAVNKLAQELIVDTNGAGDSFVGGFLSQLVQGKDLNKCVDAGHWAASVIIQRSGCTFPAGCTYK